MSDARVRIVFHIGQHKTGSKALQFFLAENVPALQGRGILYPVEEAPSHGISAYAVSQYRLFALLRREAMLACGDREGAERFWAGQSGYCHPFTSTGEMFAAMETERARLGAGCIVVSAEDLFDMSSAHETAFSLAWVEAGARILAGHAEAFRYDPAVVVYLRRQDHLLGAHYGQYIKGSASNDLDFPGFAEAFEARLRSDEILACWAAAFGPGAIRVRAYEPAVLRQGIVRDFVEEVFGVPVTDAWAWPAAGPESVNASLGRDYIEFIRLLNRGGGRGMPALPREAVLAVATPAPPGCGHGIAAWLPPAARRAILERHAGGNRAIAERYLARPGESLFTEPAPEDDGDWQAYPGLSDARAMAIRQAVLENVARQDSVRRGPARRRRRRIALYAGAGLALVMVLILAA